MSSREEHESKSSDVRQKKYINTEIALKSMCATQQCGEFNRNALLKCDPKHKMPFVIVFFFFYTKKRLCIIFSQDFLETFSSKGFLWTMAAFSML